MTKPTRYVAGFAFSNDSVMLIHKQRPTWQRNKLNAIGGHVEPNETPLQAIIREFKEETGLVVEGCWNHFCTLVGISDMGLPSQSDFIVYFYRTQCSLSPILGLTDEEPVFVLVSDVINRKTYLPTIPNLRWLVPMAFLTSEHDWPYLVEERGGTSSIVVGNGLDVSGKPLTGKELSGDSKVIAHSWCNTSGWKHKWLEFVGKIKLPYRKCKICFLRDKT